MFFQTKILCKKRGCFLKMAGIDNNKLMELLIIAGGSLLLSQEHIKGKRKQKKTKKKKGRVFEKERQIVKEHIIRS